jgi:Zn-dependent M32 family carboxypeptidase
MSLSYEDLQAIRKVVEETVHPVRGDIEALSNDIKEIYEMLTELQKKPEGSELLEKLSIEKKLLKLHAELIEAARQAGVTLPNH